MSKLSTLAKRLKHAAAQKGRLATTEKFKPWFDGATRDDGILPDDLAEIIDGFFGGDTSTFERVLPDVKEARDKVPELLAVPPKYKMAYRFIANLNTKRMSELLGVKNPPLKGVLKDHTYKPHHSRIVSSWTVNPLMFSEALKDQNGFYQGHDGGYIVLLETDVASQRDKFFFNPDVLYDYLRNSDQNYQREIVAVGPVTIKTLYYANYPAEMRDYGKHARQFLQENNILP